LKQCAPGDTGCVWRTTANYASVDAQQQKAVQNCNWQTCRNFQEDVWGATDINTSANVALCQGVAACEGLLNKLPAENQTALSTAANRGQSTQNARSQEVTQQALTNSGLDPRLSVLSPIDVSGAMDVPLSALAGAIVGRGTGGGLTVADQIGILRDANTVKGNFSLGEATAADANALGKDWVGPGYRVSQTDGTTLISADGLRQYRPPATKSSSYATTGVQANFQSRDVPSGGWQNNGHLNIKGP